MTSIDNIVDARGMIETRQHLHTEIDTLISGMWRHCRAEVDGKNKWVPYFPRSPEVDGVIARIDEADRKLATLEGDANEIATLMSGYSSIAEMARAKTTWKNALARADDAVKAAMANAVRQGIPLEDVRSVEAVTEAELKRDQIVAEISEKLKDIEPRLSKAKGILERYPPGASQ